MKRTERIRLLLFLGALLACLTGCNTSPDKRLLQYLNTDGFGNRYTGNAEEDNYLRIGDTLAITDSYAPEELSVNATVDIDGTVVLPELGAVHVAGRTRTEVEALLMEKYQNYFDLVDIKVAIFTANKNYFIFGEVLSEGAVPFTGDLTLFEAVMAASPDKNTANLGRVRLIRADPRDPFKTTVNIADMMVSGDSTFNITIQERDIIYVPPNMLAQLGYFIDDLLFPVKYVLGELTGAIFSADRINQIVNRPNGVF